MILHLWRHQTSIPKFFEKIRFLTTVTSFFVKTFFLIDMEIAEIKRFRKCENIFFPSFQAKNLQHFENHVRRGGTLYLTRYCQLESFALTAEDF